ncbi:ClpP/crotonase [Suillus bovinus]|uniref:ClpP/crotonase n=1 Tax=Suillus bovinus TaxID=48563 RepID=UPI001B86FA10|nr:ClpP/crotonase [Suillus bovinus]KAG2126791.1 ClpP/crotonase [Suillus bovinus]
MSFVALSRSHPPCKQQPLVSSPQACPRRGTHHPNRPKALNALNAAHFQDISDAMKELMRMPVWCYGSPGSERAFAAGADIKEMKDKSFAEAYTTTSSLIGKSSQNLTSRLLQPSVVTPAFSTTWTARSQSRSHPWRRRNPRLARLIGKSRAMELVLTGRIIGADEAERWGIVRVVREGNVVDEAVKVASEIASKGRIAVGAGKEAVNAAFEMSLAEGLRFEKRLFHALFSTKDQKEGMTAFSEKRKAEWTHIIRAFCILRGHLVRQDPRVVLC